MAIFGKDRERNERLRTGVSDTPLGNLTPAQGKTFEHERTSVDETAQANAFLGKGSKVSGKLIFEGTVRIEGQVDGEISAQDTLIIGEHAVVNAQITGGSIVIHGRVTGDVIARKRLEVRTPGRLLGNITSPVLVIQEGVVFEGQCSMGGGEAQRTDKKVTLLSKEERAPEGATLKVSELAK